MTSAADETTGSARGEEPGEVEFQRGVALYEAGSHEEAAAAFEQAYALHPNPLYLFSWAQAEVARDRCEEAVVVFRRYLDSDPPEANRLAAESRIATCQERIAAATPPPPEPTSSAGLAPSPPPPGSASAAPSAADAPVTAPAVTPAPTATGVQTPASRADPAADGPTRWWGDPLALTLLGAGTLATGAGAGVMIWAQSTYASARDQTYDTYEAHQRALDAARERRIAGGVTLGAGLALIGGGILRAVLVDGDGDDAMATTTPLLWWTPQGGALGVTTLF